MAARTKRSYVGVARAKKPSVPSTPKSTPRTKGPMRTSDFMRGGRLSKVSTRKATKTTKTPTTRSRRSMKRMGYPDSM